MPPSTPERPRVRPLRSSSPADLQRDYYELRARSAFCFLEGASLPEALAERAAELEYPSLAVAALRCIPRAGITICRLFRVRGGNATAIHALAFSQLLRKQPLR